MFDMHYLKDSCFLDSTYQCKDVFEVRDVWAVIGDADTQSSPWMSFPEAAVSSTRRIKQSKHVFEFQDNWTTIGGH